MKYSDIVKVAEYQRVNWKETTGVISGVDLIAKKLVMNSNLEYKLNPNAFVQSLERLELKNTYKDFESDTDFMQKAVSRRLERRMPEKRDNRIIYDQNTKEAKAVVSVTYHQLCNADAMKLLIRKNPNLESNMDDRNSFINDDHIKIVTSPLTKEEAKSKAQKLELKRGDEIGFGMLVTNSNTKNGALKLNMAILRLACTNGSMSIEEGTWTSIKHVNDELLMSFDREYDKIFQPKKYIELMERAIDRPALATFETAPNILKHYGIKAEFHASILEQIRNDPIGVSSDGINGWALYNGLTRFTTHVLPQLPGYDAWDSHLLVQSAYPLLKL